MKKKVVLFIAVMMLFAFAVPSAVYAEDVMEEEQIFPGALQDISKYKAEAPEAVQSRAAVEFKEYDETQLLFELEEKVKEGLLSGESRIDIEDMRIDSKKYDAEQLVYFSPYLSNGISAVFYFDPSSGAYMYIELTNTMTIENTKKHFEEIDRAVCEFAGQVQDEMTVEEKALVIHDYFVSQFEYDYDNYQAGTIPEDSYRSGGLFKNRKGVCQAYAYGYKYIMNMLGIECHVTSSDQMNHAWNIIKIDEAYYHVDCTFDDPVRDKLGLVSHKHFLLSDDIMEHERDHYGWNLKDSISCNSTEYDDAYWQEVTSPIILVDGNIYFIRKTSKGNSLCKFNTETANEESLAQLGNWNVWQSGATWVGVFSGLFIEGNEIYYNTSTEIKKMSLEDEAEKVVYKPEDNLKNGYIYGLRKKGETIEYLILDSPEEKSCTYREIFAAPITFSEQEVTGILLNKQNLQLEEGEKFSFAYTLTPQGVTSKVTWTTIDAKVAKIEADGTLTARSAGNATITATTENGKTSKCQVTVTRKSNPITGITLDKGTMSLEVGKTGSLTATIKPADTTESQDLVWKTNNAGVATVDDKGTVTAVAAGEATITVTASNGMQAECKVTVTGTVKPITSISLDNSQLTLEEGKSSTLTATIEPADAAEGKDLVWNTSNADVATVDKGTVTAVAAGEATITVAVGEKKAECKVTVIKKADDTGLPFVDVGPEWYLESVEYVYEKGIMKGYAAKPNCFGPSNELARAEFVTILSRLEESEPVVEYDPAVFPDVAEDSYFMKPAIWAQKIGVVTGYAHNGCFGPADNISREQMATMMYRYAKYLGLDVSEKGDLSKFPDAGKISDYAKEALEWAVGSGLITGEGGKYINPQGYTQRAQCAAIIMRFMEKYNI